MPTQTEVREYTVLRSLEIMNFSREYFNIPSDINFNTKINFNDYRTSSWGGTKIINGKVAMFISLGLNKIINTPIVGFYEYKSISNDRIIGSFSTSNWKDVVDGLLTHEIAHCVQYIMPWINQDLKSGNSHPVLGSFNSGHKNFWRKIYQILRIKFVNNKVQNIGKMNVSNGSSKPFDININMGKEFIHPRLGNCKIVGINSRAYKYNIIFKSITMDKFYKTSKEDIQRLVNV